MKNKINPNNDYVVKMMLARQSKAHVLVHFLNSVVEPSCPIVEVFIQDPHNHRQSQDDKLSVADSLAKDIHGNFYQIEIQNSVPRYLHSRITYTSHTIYGNQLVAGDNYDKAKPIHSIWLLNENMFAGEHFRHRLIIADYETNALLPDSQFYIIELAKWQPESPLEQMTLEQLKALHPIVYWLYFMKEAENWYQLPEFLSHIPIMRELMAILEEISDRGENYARYLSAQDAMRVKLSEEALRIEAEESLKTVQAELSQAEQELSQAEQELSQTTDELSQAEQELSQTAEELSQTAEELTQTKDLAQKYREKLIAAGINPDEL